MYVYMYVCGWMADLDGWGLGRLFVMVEVSLGVVLWTIMLTAAGEGHSALQPPVPHAYICLSFSELMITEEGVGMGQKGREAWSKRTRIDSMYGRTR